MNHQFRACVREVFTLNPDTNEWRGRWDVSGTVNGHARQITHESPMENINAPNGERETAVRELWTKARAMGLVAHAGVLELPKRNKHLSRYLG